MNVHYSIHTPESAPDPSRRLLEATAKRLGSVPNLVGVMAESPELLGAFFHLTQVSAGLTLAALEREVVAMTVAVEVGCSHCLAMHTMALRAMKADVALVDALISDGAIGDPALATLREFTRQVIRGRGDVSETTHETWFTRGYTSRQAIEVVFLVGMLTMSTYVSRLARVPLEEAMQALAS
jgi:AhpD family alkylhydroperoxidase